MRQESGEGDEARRRALAVCRCACRPPPSVGQRSRHAPQPVHWLPFELPPGSRNRHLRLEAYERDALKDKLAAGLAVALAAWGAAAALRRRTTAGAGEDEGKGKAE